MLGLAKLIYKFTFCKDLTAKRASVSLEEADRTQRACLSKTSEIRLLRVQPKRGNCLSLEPTKSESL